MTLQERLRDDLNQAMKRGDKSRRLVLRLALAGVQNAEIAQGSPLDDSGVLGIIAKEVRQHRESIEAFTQGNRPDLVSQEETELAVLLEYLPQQMSREEITRVARQVIEEVGARGVKDKGKVMPKLVAQLKGRADGRDINAVASELLAALTED
jgi:uncharacterized protein YqeY